MKSFKPQVPEESRKVPTLGEIGLTNYAPYLMNRIMGRYNASIRSDINARGLSTPKMRALAVLSVIDRIQTGELANYAVIEQSTLSRSLDQLVADGLVRRETDPRDNRATLLHITEKGRQTFELLWPVMAQTYMSLFEGIPASERIAFVGTLKKILDNLNKSET